MSEQIMRADVRDMYSVHEAFRRGLREAKGQIRAVEGYPEGAARFSSYLGDLLWLLHGHHEGEDILLYPLLAERVSSAHVLLEEMDGQHRGVTDALNACIEANASFAVSASRTDGDALIAACHALSATLLGHLDQEETDVLPLVEDWITPEEWGQLPVHVLMSYSGERLWMPFGLAIEAMPADLLAAMAVQLPPPVSEMWFGGGADAYATEMASIRVGG